MTKRNGLTLRNISIAIGILLALGGILWGFAVHSGDVDRVIVDVIEVEGNIKSLDKRVDTVEDAVIVIQSDFKHIKSDLIEQKELSREILREIRK